MIEGEIEARDAVVQFSTSWMKVVVAGVIGTRVTKLCEKASDSPSVSALGSQFGLLTYSSQSRFASVNM